MATKVRFSAALVAVAMGALLWQAGCGNLALTAAGVPNEFGPIGTAGIADAGPTEASLPSTGVDAGASAPVSAMMGSPLCGITNGCVPDPNYTAAGSTCPVVVPVFDSGIVGNPGDDDGEALDAGLLEDGSPTDDDGSSPPVLDSGRTLDSGAAAAYDAAAPVPACRVSESDGGTMCGDAGSGDAGASCKTGEDCAAGLECVGDGNGNGVCRQYCCLNNCGSAAEDAGPQGSGSGAEEPDASVAPAAFCDIETLHDDPTRAVPVCVEKPSCMLFAPCPSAGETCTVVDSNGTTACVATGPMQVGQSCEEQHCGAGLVCWGTFPERTCAQLCDAMNPCTAPLTCMSNYSNFDTTSDPSAGVCVTASPSASP